MVKKYIDGEMIDVVDLTPTLIKYAEEGHKEFKDAYDNGQTIFKMSFDKGVVYDVLVGKESNESDEYDPKYDVTVIGIHIDPRKLNQHSFRACELYELGYKRWVRTYDLKTEVN